MKEIKNIVLNIPHSSMNKYNEGWDIKDVDIDNQFLENVKYQTDLYTDMIFGLNDSKNIQSIIVDVNRFYCDVERLENDILEKYGNGIIYTKSPIGIERNLTDEKKQEILNTIYYPHIKKVKALLNENSLLIDCHSFNDDNFNSGIEINLGFNEDWSKPCQELFDLIYNYFIEEKYVIGINTPYSNSFAPKTDFDYPSIMIEVNKKLYLTEDNKLQTDAYKFHYKIARLYKEILGSNF